jgi:beta-mannanase
VVSIFRGAGATNVRWVWSPNVDDGNLPFSDLYPGDRWVDWVSLDGYAWGSLKGGAWRSLESVFAASYDRLTRLTTKPVMIAETSANEDGHDKAEWIRTGLGRVLAQRFPRVRALIWFDKRFEGADWRVDSSPAALNTLRSVVASPAFSSDPSTLLSATAAVARVPRRR